MQSIVGLFYYSKVEKVTGTMPGYGLQEEGQKEPAKEDLRLAEDFLALACYLSCWWFLEIKAAVSFDPQMEYRSRLKRRRIYGSMNVQKSKRKQVGFGW